MEIFTALKSRNLFYKIAQWIKSNFFLVYFGYYQKLIKVTVYQHYLIFCDNLHTEVDSTHFKRRPIPKVVPYLTHCTYYSCPFYGILDESKSHFHHIVGLFYGRIGEGAMILHLIYVTLSCYH